MDAKKCDRCGGYYTPGMPYSVDSKALKLLKGDTNLQMRLHTIRSGGGFSRTNYYDICYDCVLDLDKWFMDKEEKTT